MSSALLRQADGAHGVVDAAAAEAGLGDGERLALAAEQRLGRHAHVVVVDERVRCPRRAARRARPTLRTMFTPGVSVGTRNIDMPWYALTSGLVTAMTIRNDAVLRVGREELPAVDHPLVAVLAPPAS